MGERRRHPRHSVGRIWAGLALVFAAGLILLRVTDRLPLGDVGKLAPLSLPATLPVALLIGATLSLPLALLLGHRDHAPAILRPTAGKLFGTLGLSLLVPGLITETGWPYMLGPFYLFLAWTNPSARALSGVLVYFALAWALLYPTVAAVIWGLPRRSRLAGLIGIPLGLYALLYLMGGSV